MAATHPPKRLSARSVASRARQWGARLGAFLLGLWIALFASMCAGAESAVQRIVSVGAELTEIVYALGAEARLVGVDTTSRWPAAARVLFLMGLQQGAPVAAGAGTSAQAMIELAGGANALTGFSGYRPVSPEALAQARPDVLLVPEHALGAMGGAEGILSQPGVELTCAGRQRRLVVMDGLYLLGFGPRLGEAVTDLARALRESSGCAPSALMNHAERGARGGLARIPWGPCTASDRWCG